MAERNYWLRQTDEKPLYADLLWSRPENRLAAGKLLIAGGNQFGFVEPSEAFRSAEKAGIGTVRLVLPDSLSTYIGKTFEAGVLVPSTPSGSFSQRALGYMLQEADWSDGVLLAGGLGRNSETAILLEKFAGKYAGQLTITKDAADYFTGAPQPILTRPNTLLVITLAQLQKLAVSAKFVHPFTFGMDLLRLVDTLHEFEQTYQLNIVLKHLEALLVASGGKVSSTKLSMDKETWRVQTAATASVWWLQNSGRTFEALTTAVFMCCRGEKQTG